jgi:hypothetical protein
MAGRTTTVLEAFPRHLGATDPGKRVRTVVDALAGSLDVQARQLGEVRRAHRLPDTPTRRDLLAMAALHRVGDAALGIVDARLVGLSAAADPVSTADVELIVGLPVGALDTVDPTVLTAVVAALVGVDGRLGVQRRTVEALIAAFRGGNATATALLAAAGAYLGLALAEVAHSEDRWWHLARCRDVLHLDLDLPPGDDLLAVEENPFVPITVEPVARRHGDRFRILRGGLDAITVGVRVVGVADRTVRPMVVNVDEGRGVAFTGAVLEGAELVFEVSGRVVLGGLDVTGSAYGFTGAVFASADEEVPDADFVLADAADPAVFGDRAAVFAVAAPVATALGALGGFPHAAAGVAPLRMALGQSRWAVFVAVAHLGAQPAEVARPALPVPFAAVADRAVFADARPVEQHEPAARVGFAWEEREPFTVRVVVPRRLSVVDDDAGSRLREPLRALLDRHRAAGVRLEVTYAEERWELGGGITRDGDSGEALGTVVVGTTLWPDGTMQPGPP